MFPVRGVPARKIHSGGVLSVYDTVKGLRNNIQLRADYLGKYPNNSFTVNDMSALARLRRAAQSKSSDQDCQERISMGSTAKAGRATPRR
jgi:hypothetical protein